MNQWIKIAFRNIRKNRRRSVVTILAVAVGFAAVGLFRGYTANTYDGLRQSAIRGEGLGHLTIYKTGWLENGQNDPEHTLLTAEEIRKIIAVAKTDPDVRLATPQLSISGLVSNGRTSHIFLAMGVVPVDYRTIAGPMAARRPVTGKPLDGGIPYGILMADKLARLLQLKPDSDAVLMANTLDGQMNALDIRVNGTYDTGTEATSDKYLLLPYAYAQKLYDTDRADRIVVLLDDWQHTRAARARISRNLAAAGLHCEIKTWNELSVFYGKVRGMFDMIFLFIFLIVLVIVVMSTVNTMSMSVVERTREIGTLRVLGVKRRGIGQLFAIEGALLGVFGCLCGAALNILVWAVIHAAGPSYVPPGLSTPVPLIVSLLPGAMVRLTLFLTILSVAAAVLPARRAARMEIAEALGHV
ncbi:MAG: FtsX-like permease family protein [Desulfobacteraceae bacterium]|jgi:putative ABC transport system permease protein